MPMTTRAQPARPRRLEREAGQLHHSLRTLAQLRNIIAAPGDDSLRHRQEVNLGRFVAEEHYVLTGALADADLPEEARVLLAAGDTRRALGERRTRRAGARRGDGASGAGGQLTGRAGGRSGRNPWARRASHSAL
ncbi:hypothetical protein ABZV31_05960 [Streptomyces sp. NPDC005202]|uniref:hypothetical protein n=1 Tax=Streptomyces sp. NPDC005202 TaxID=3157021 RepID=UPI00339E3763